MKKLVAGVWAFVSAMVMTACGGVEQGDLPSGDPGTKIPGASDGLTVLETDEASGKVALRYQSQGHSVRYDLRVGPAMEELPDADELANDPELPTHQIDVRIAGASGQPFYMQMGGDAFIDSDWKMLPVEGFDLAERLAEIRLLREALPGLRATSLPGVLDQARLSAIQIGLGAATSDATKAAEPGVDAASPALETESTTLQSGPTSTNQWDFFVSTHSVAEFGDHSAVQLRAWHGSSIVATYNSCNHGSCANASNMARHCTMSGFKKDDGTHTRFFYSETATSTGSITGGCRTDYNVQSNCSGHNCNDDSELQGKAIWYDKTQSTTTGSCKNCGWHLTAPGCSY